MSYDENNDTDENTRNLIDPPASDTSLGSGIAQMDPAEEDEQREEEDIFDAGDVDREAETAITGPEDRSATSGDTTGGEEAILDLGSASEEGETAVAEPDDDLETWAKKAAELSRGENDEDEEVLDLGSVNEETETAVSESEEDAEPEDELARLAGGTSSGGRRSSARPRGRLSSADLRSPVSSETKARRQKLKQQQARQSSQTLRKAAIPLLITMGVTLVVVGIITIVKGSDYDALRDAQNHLLEHYGLFSFSAILLGVVLGGIAVFLHFDEAVKKKKRETRTRQKTRNGSNGRKQ